MSGICRRLVVVRGPLEFEMTPGAMTMVRMILRIEDLTLMTRLATTMTIKPRIIFTPDVTIDNEGIVLPATVSDVGPLYALTLVLANQDRDMTQRRASCLSAAVELIA